MSFSELSTSILFQAGAVSTSTPPEQLGLAHPIQQQRTFVRMPDPNCLIGKAILGFSAVERMTLPEGWSETRHRTGATGNKVFREYTAARNCDVSLSFLCAERALEVQARLLLLQILQLSSPPEAWIQSLPQAQYFSCLENPREFLLLSARCGELNGRRALIMEGCNARTSRSAYVVIVDTDSGGRLPLSICYLAPKQLYVDYMRDVLESLSTIVWK